MSKPCMRRAVSYQPKKVRVQAVIANAGSEAATETNVSLLLNGKSLESRR